MKIDVGDAITHELLVSRYLVLQSSPVSSNIGNYDSVVSCTLPPALTSIYPPLWLAQSLTTLLLCHYYNAVWYDTWLITCTCSCYVHILFGYTMFVGQLMHDYYQRSGINNIMNQHTFREDMCGTFGQETTHTTIPPASDIRAASGVFWRRVRLI